MSSVVLLITMSISAQKVEISGLPDPALVFIEKYFPGVPVIKAKKDVDEGQKGYKVMLANGVSIGFGKDGVYRKVDGNDKPIPTDYINPKIVGYVKSHYPEQRITSIDYRKKSVDVDLTGKIDLEFTKDGTLIRGKKK